MIREFFGIKGNLSWYDIKTKFKKIIRSFFYRWLLQELICLIIISYMKLVYFTSKVVFINHHFLLDSAKNGRGVILASWHSRLMLSPFITLQPNKDYPEYKFSALASRHGDGQFVSRIMTRFGLNIIHGSTQGGRKSSRGVNISDMKQIFSSLKNGDAFAITPDGPRGPKQKVNGQVSRIAQKSGVEIMPISYSASRNIKLKTWDEFIVPLPFSKICFSFGKPLEAKGNLEKIDKKLEKEIDLVTGLADDECRVCSYKP